MTVTSASAMNGFSLYDVNAGADKQKKSEADYETFIKLLVAQMKNQDPMEPVDATQYVSQLASFSSVEQVLQTNAKLDALLVQQPMLQAGHYVGKHVSNEDGSIRGIVTSVTIYGDGLVATLDNGRELVIGPGVSVGLASETDMNMPEQPETAGGATRKDGKDAVEVMTS